MGWLSGLLARFLPAPPDIRPGEDVIFLDVRTTPEFHSGHVADALHIPLAQLPDRAADLEPHRDARILVYCLSGHRAGRAVRELRSRGFPNAENAGGIGGLRRIGLRIARDR